MDEPIKKYDEVWTADKQNIGEALAWHERPAEEVNPEQKLYARYLEVWSILLGGHCYIPAEFVGDYQPGRINLLVKLATIEDETWDRAPAFVAGRKSVRYELPVGQKTAVI